MRRLSLALVLIMALVLSACSSTSTTPSAATQAPAAKATPAPAAPAPATQKVRGVTDTEIVIGTYHALSGGSVSPLGIARDKAWTAYWKWLNDQGGINGRKIRFIVEDSQADPQKALALTKKLVEQDGVFAMVYGQNSAEGMATRPYLVQQGVAHLMIGCPLSECQAPAPGWWSAYLPYDQESAFITESVVKENKLTKVGVLYANSDYGKDNLKGVKAAAPKAGAQVVAEVAFVPSDVDMSAAAIKLKNSGAEVVYLASYPAQANGLWQESKKLGYKPLLMGTQAQGIPDIAKLMGADAEGIYTTLPQTVDLSSESDADVKNFKAAMAKYSPDADAKDPGNFTIWLQSVAATEILKRAGKDLSNAAIDKAALTLKDFGPLHLTYTPEQHWGVSGYPLARWNKDKLVDAKNYKP